MRTIGLLDVVAAPVWALHFHGSLLALFGLVPLVVGATLLIEGERRRVWHRSERARRLLEREAAWEACRAL